MLASRIGKWLSNSLNSGKIIHGILDPVVEQRFEERARRKLGYDVPEHVSDVENADCIDSADNATE